MSEPTKFYTPVPNHFLQNSPCFLTLESNGKAWIFCSPTRRGREIDQTWRPVFDRFFFDANGDCGILLEGGPQKAVINGVEITSMSVITPGKFIYMGNL